MTLVRRLNPVELPKLIELSTNVVDTNTSFTIFEIRVNIQSRELNIRDPIESFLKIHEHPPVPHCEIIIKIFSPFFK